MKQRLLELFKKHAVRDGHLRYVYVLLCAFVGVGLPLIDLYQWHTGWLYIVGLGIGAFGGYSAQAYVLKIRPFEDPPYPPGWLTKKKATRFEAPDERKEGE
ncbi:hypothetical protein LP085_30790 [Achromobacter sp. MY14]|uniref:hypothetical protein n=1 Tax=unclassified Achromobacter TaxID=2626865 RepID=UPI001E35B8C4|nr:hypothetical protein [Achromobacter sp. MY14]MCD0501269.1 hypothetical protein [Achromobacter sp. MY14]